MSLPTFKNPSLFLRAHTHRSYINEHAGAGEDNERLEFLGDAVLDFVAASFLYHNYPAQNEGGLTKLRSALVNTDQLAALAMGLDLGRELRLGKGEEDTGGRQRPTLLCAAFEAMIGAYYLDSGLDAVRVYIEPLFKVAAENIILGDKDTDGKSLFQEWAQAERGITPRYVLVSVAGPDHNREYTVEVLVGDEVMGSGTGPSKQSATQAAARAALANVGRR
jgi:ribonuclease-3